MKAAARGRPYGRAVATAQKWATKLHASLFRATAGRVGGRIVGSPVLLLNTRCCGYAWRWRMQLPRQRW
jgi:hypothetical protein